MICSTYELDNKRNRNAPLAVRDTDNREESASRAAMHGRMYRRIGAIRPVALKLDEVVVVDNAVAILPVVHQII